DVPLHAGQSPGRARRRAPRARRRRTARRRRHARVHARRDREASRPRGLGARAAGRGPGAAGATRGARALPRARAGAAPARRRAWASREGAVLEGEILAVAEAYFTFLEGQGPGRAAPDALQRFFEEARPGRGYDRQVTQALDDLMRRGEATLKAS